MTNPENHITGRPIDRRVMTTLTMICSLFWLPISGLAIHFSDPNPRDPVHHTAMAVHNLAAILFVVSVVFHLILNWKAVMKHVVARVNDVRLVRREFVLIGCAVTLLVLLFGSHGLLAH